MLKHTFIFLDGIGPGREASLWRNGITTWKDFVSVRKIRGISEDRKLRLDEIVSSADEHLRRNDAEYFASKLPSREAWRCLREFSESAVYLDIETTGVSTRAPITVVGVHDGRRTHTLVRGRNLDGWSLRLLLESARVIVTFNGASFDIPAIQRQFPGSVPQVPHVDLRHVMRRIGYAGGLKTVERDLGIERDRRLELMTGADAVYLWRAWERKGNQNALDMLVKYNSADCENLRALADFAYRTMRKRTYDCVAAR